MSGTAISESTSETSPPAVAAPRLLDQVSVGARQRGHSEQAVAGFAAWIRRFIVDGDEKASHYRDEKWTT